MRAHPLTIVLFLAAAAGFAFAAVSTSDFVAHLDRQVHGIHCSFLPGIGKAEAGQTGCHVTLMSPYSSVMRDSVWGGIPISLPAMSVFAFLGFWAIWLALRDRQEDSRATLFTVLATALPATTSGVMAYISLSELDAACKLCIGIYLASAVAFLAALFLWLRARGEARSPFGAETPRPPPVAWGVLALSFVLGIVFVAAPVTTYATAAPDFSSYVGSCGEMTHGGDPQLLVPIGPQDREVQMIEVLDPLCPSCKGFEERYQRMEVERTLSRRALLFPLDNACNWMVSDAIHPGACTLSEAMLCAGARAEEVLQWAFENQEAVVGAAKNDPKAAERMVTSRFPDLARCVGSAAVKNKLNLVLRLGVKNRLQVLTPQVFVEGYRLCDEDTDLGLDYALTRLVALAKSAPKRPPPSAPEPAFVPRPVPRPAPIAAARLAAPPPSTAAPAPEAAPAPADAPPAPTEAAASPAPAEPAPAPAPEAPSEAAPAAPEAEEAAP
jgi:uncharacterized membrane protein